MRTLRTGAAVVLIAGLHSLAAQSPVSDRGTATAAPRTGHALGFYDGRLRRVVLVGAPGDPKDGDRDSVWIWSGATWEPVTDAGPPGRVNAGGAYGARRGRAVVAGGSRKAADGATWEVVGDTWEGDQSGWRRVDAVSPRDHHALVEDGRGAVLMYGGMDVAIEAAGEGVDTVQVASTYTLSSTQELENLTLLGSSTINGIGNSITTPSLAIAL